MSNFSDFISKYFILRSKEWVVGEELPIFNDRVIVPPSIGGVLESVDPKTFSIPSIQVKLLSSMENAGYLKSELDYAVALHAISTRKWVVDTEKYYLNVGEPYGVSNFIRIEKDEHGLSSVRFTGVDEATLISLNTFHTDILPLYRQMEFLVFENVAIERYGGLPAGSSYRSEEEILENRSRQVREATVANLEVRVAPSDGVSSEDGFLSEDGFPSEDGFLSEDGFPSEDGSLETSSGVFSASEVAPSTKERASEWLDSVTSSSENVSDSESGSFSETPSPFVEVVPEPASEGDSSPFKVAPVTLNIPNFPSQGGNDDLQETKTFHVSDLVESSTDCWASMEFESATLSSSEPVSESESAKRSLTPREEGALTAIRSVRAMEKPKEESPLLSLTKRFVDL